MTRKLATLAVGLLAATGLTIASAAPAAADSKDIKLILDTQDDPDSPESVNVSGDQNASPNNGDYSISQDELPIDVDTFDDVYSFEARSGIGLGTSSLQKFVLYVFGTSWQVNSATPNNAYNSTNSFTASLTDTEHSGVSVTTCSGQWSLSNGSYTCPDGETEGDPVQIISGTFGPSGPSGPAGSGTSAGGSLPTHLQQFVKSPDMTCDETQPEGLNWSGAPSGGWGESWAQWPNDGQGGNVCTRTLFYNNSTGSWDVR